MSKKVKVSNPNTEGKLKFRQYSPMGGTTHNQIILNPGNEGELEVDYNTVIEVSLHNEEPAAPTNEQP